MGLFRLRRKEAQQISEELNAGEIADATNSTPISKELFTMEQPPEQSEMPIFEVYRRLAEDWETKGYTDAKAFPESSYKENNKMAIVKKLALLIEESIVKYYDKIEEMESLIALSKKNGFIETLARQEMQLAILTRHLKELNELAKDINSVGVKTKVILTSYDMGFARGIATISNERVNTLMK